MANKRLLTKSDVEYLKKELVPDIKKEVVTDVKKLLLAQDIRNWAKMEELEVKFEKKITEAKSDFLEKIEPILAEVKTKREERPLVANRLSNHSDRIETLEKIHPKGTHILATS